MTLSGRAKVLLALATLVGIAAYLVVVDLGIFAGRIHHGVHVRYLNVGGLTKDEATEVLEEEAERLATTPVILTQQGMSCSFEPTELGWDPRPPETATAAYRVGRGADWLVALGNRIKAWAGGATIDWNDRFDRSAVSDLLDRCEEQADGLGYDLRRFKLRARIREAIKTWPRTPVTIPVRTS